MSPRVEEDAWRGIDPVFEDHEARAGRKSKIDRRMIMPEDEAVNFMRLFVLRRELVQRLILIPEHIFFIMGETAVTRPGISQTVGQPRMDGAEHYLKRTTVENAPYDTVTERYRSETVTMPEAESHSRNFHYGRLYKPLHSEIFEITVCPDVMIAREEIHVHSPVDEFLYGSQDADIPFRHDITVFVPEVPDVAEKVQGLRISREAVEKIGKTTLTAGRIADLEA